MDLVSSFMILVVGSHTWQEYRATGFIRLSTSFSIVLVDRALVSTMRLMEKNARNAFFLSSSIANLKDPFRLNVIPR